MSPRCPLCGVNKYYFIFEKLPNFPGAAIVKCNNCSHVYTLLTGEPDKDELYNDKVYKIVDTRKSLFDKILTWEYSRVLKRIHEFKSAKGLILDFGSGKGKLAGLAKENGWQIKGVETAKERAEYSRKVYDLEVSTDYYSTGRIYNDYFDVLTMFHVLEHLPSPQILLTELVKHNLKKDGLIVIEVPNIKSWQASIAGRKWMHLDIPRHISHFTPATLEQVGQQSGLVTLRTRYFSFHLGVLGMTDSLLKAFGYKGNIVYDLKNKKSGILKICIGLLLSISLPLEFISSLLGYGGITRKYMIRKPEGS